MNKQKGISQIAIMVIMLVLAVVLPVATRLVKQVQENRSKATLTLSGTKEYGESCGSDSECKSNYCPVATTKTPVRVCSEKDSDKACTTLSGTCNVSMDTDNGSVCKTTDGLTGKVAYNLCLSSSSLGTRRCCVPDLGVECVTGQQKCITGNVFVTCINNRWGVSENTCSTGYSCTSGQISEIGANVCKPNETCKSSCLSDGLTLQKCNAEGTGVGSTEMCFVTSVDDTPSSGACAMVDGFGKCVRCNSGDKDCSKDCVGQYTCKADQTGWDYKACENGCKNGECILENCTNGQQKCVGNNKYVTCANGQWGATQTACTNGTCTTDQVGSNVCVSNTCSPNTKKCLGTKLQICNSSGTGWLDVTDCGEAGCNASTLTCNAVTCITNALRCNQSTLEKCNLLGTGWEIVEQCALGCNSTTSSCINKVCDEGAKQCVNNIQSQTCVNNAWLTTNCNSLQYCLNGTCQDRSAVSANIKIKLSYNGVKVKNDQCAVGWKTTLKLIDNQGNAVLTGEKLTGVPVKTDQINSRNEIIYELSATVSKVLPVGGLNNLAFLLKGEKNMSMKYGTNNQSSYYNIFAGTLTLSEGENNYDFSKFPMYGGDVTGEQDGVPDGKIDVADWSYVKSRSDSSTIIEGPAGTNVPGDVDGNCKVNAGDVRLVTESLEVIYDQLY